MSRTTSTIRTTLIGTGFAAALAAGIVTPAIAAPPTANPSTTDSGTAGGRTLVRLADPGRGRLGSPVQTTTAGGRTYRRPDRGRSRTLLAADHPAPAGRLHAAAGTGVNTTVRFVDRTGGPAGSTEHPLTFVLIDLRRGYSVQYDGITGGSLALHDLPPGQYGGVVDIDSATDDSIVPIDDFAVSRTLSTVTFDARRATVVPSVTTPRPAGAEGISLEWYRASAGGLASLTLTAPTSGRTVHVAPTAAPQVGTMHWATHWALLGLNLKTGYHYSYDLAYDETGGVADDQHHQAEAENLALINPQIYNDGRSRNIPSYALARYAVYPYQPSTVGLFGNQEQGAYEYVTATGPVRWQDELIETRDHHHRQLFENAPRQYTAGQTELVNWLRGPLGPGIQAAGPGALPAWTCNACRYADHLRIRMAPLTDSTPGHVGYLEPRFYQGAVRSRFYQDGALLSDRSDMDVSVPVPTEPHTYRLIADADWSGTGVQVSTAGHIDEQFQSSATSGGSLPSGWICGAGGSRRCGVLPLLQIHPDVPVTSANRVADSQVDVPITVDHVQGAAATAITGAGVQLKAHDGTTWVDEPVTVLGDGRFVAHLSDDLSSQHLDLRLTASDAAGTTITETIENGIVFNDD